MTLEAYEDLRLVLSRRLAIEVERERSFVIFDQTSRTRLEVGRRLYHVMRGFQSPARVRDVIEPQLRTPLRPMIEQLVDLGFLLDADRRLRSRETHERLLVAPPQPMFRCPAGNPTTAASNVVFIGMPYDGGHAIESGCRQGADAVRTRSADQTYRLDSVTHAPMGWFAVETQQHLLDGVTLADWGNIRSAQGESPETLFERAGRVFELAVRSGAVPVLLGGDHSVSFAAIEALQDQEPLTVVWLDAHTACGELMPTICHNHKNVVRRLFGLPNVRQIVNVGHRGFTTSDRVNQRPPRFSVVTAEQVRQEGPDPLIALLPKGGRCYVSIDIDVLDPIHAPATSTPVPGGLTPAEVKRLLRAIGAQTRIAGIDLVEITPSRETGMLTLLQACELLTVALAAAFPAGTKDADRTRGGATRG